MMSLAKSSPCERWVYDGRMLYNRYEEIATPSLLQRASSTTFNLDPSTLIRVTNALSLVIYQTLGSLLCGVHAWNALLSSHVFLSSDYRLKQGRVGCIYSSWRVKYLRTYTSIISHIQCNIEIVYRSSYLFVPGRLRDPCHGIRMPCFWRTFLVNLSQSLLPYLLIHGIQDIPLVVRTNPADWIAEVRRSPV